MPRDKNTIKRIFSTIGVQMDEDSWENCWKEAVKYQEQYDAGLQGRSNSGDKVSVECFSLILDNITNAAVA